MNIEKTELHATVREGYQILLRADAYLLMPTDKPKIRAFYEKMSQTCMKWAQEVHGEGLRKEFLALDGIREKSRFRTQRYRMQMSCPWQAERYVAFLCESELTGQWKTPQKSYHRISHVWDTEEELILPFSQILKQFGMPLTKEKLPFRPDGIYPMGDQLVFFRNVTDQMAFLEKKLPITRV